MPISCLLPLTHIVIISSPGAVQTLEMVQFIQLFDQVSFIESECEALNLEHKDDMINLQATGLVKTDKKENQYRGEFMIKCQISHIFPEIKHINGCNV